MATPKAAKVLRGESVTVSIGDVIGPQRVADTLNRFVGALHAARCTAVVWIQNAENPAYVIAAKYGLQMTFGTTVLTLRKFLDLWQRGPLKSVLLPDTDAWNACEWILNECKVHNTRKAANLLFAHYAERPSDLPLSPKEVEALVHSGGWPSEEAVVEWSGPVIDKLRLVRDDIIDRHSFTALSDEEPAT